jgi:hypothetical protein
MGACTITAASYNSKQSKHNTEEGEMKVTLGEDGLQQTWLARFPETAKCCRCNGVARIGFVAHEGMTEADRQGPFVCDLHPNGGKGAYWPHDCVAVAVYFCRNCMETTALYNQA